MSIKRTLLQMTQQILSSMDSDEIQSINDTTESTQVVDIIEGTYYDLASTIDFPDYWDFFQLEDPVVGDPPTLMHVPSRIGKIEWIKYDLSDPGETARNWINPTPLDREAFFSRMDKLDSVESNVYHTDLSSGIDVRGYNDRAPVYYTTINDGVGILFDNFDAGISTTLVGSSTRCYGMMIPDFLREDDFIAQFEPRQYTLFFNEAKAQCWVDLKQVANQKTEQRARRGWVQAHRKLPLLPEGNVHNTWTPNYGRRR